MTVLRVPGGELHYEAEGDGVAVVLVHVPDRVNCVGNVRSTCKTIESTDTGNPQTNSRDPIPTPA